MFSSNDSDRRTRYPSIREWFASDLDVKVKGNNEIHLIAPCGDVRYFRPSQIQALIEKLEAAMRDSRADIQVCLICTKPLGTRKDARFKPHMEFEGGRAHIECVEKKT